MPTLEAPTGCPASSAVRLLSRPYLLEVLGHLMEAHDRPLRFVEIQARVRTTANTLSARLRELEAAGLVTRAAFVEIPPRVEYRATAKARELHPMLEEMASWDARGAGRPTKMRPHIS